MWRFKYTFHRCKLYKWEHSCQSRNSQNLNNHFGGLGSSQGYFFNITRLTWPRVESVLTTGLCLWKWLNRFYMRNELDRIMARVPTLITRLYLLTIIKIQSVWYTSHKVVATNILALKVHTVFIVSCFMGLENKRTG